MDGDSEVVVIGKRRRDDAHTVLAAGGINAALGTVDPQDSWQQHYADTLREGVPGMGAGAVETPGAEDVYTLTATPRILNAAYCDSRYSGPLYR